MARSVVDSSLAFVAVSLEVTIVILFCFDRLAPEKRTPWKVTKQKTSMVSANAQSIKCSACWKTKPNNRRKVLCRRMMVHLCPVLNIPLRSVCLKFTTTTVSSSKQITFSSFSVVYLTFEEILSSVYDLLAPTLTKDNHGTLQRKSLDIRHGTEGTIEVPGLTKEKVTDVNEVLTALDRGNSNRATSSTNLNERSSRSHMILQVEVTSGVGEAKHKASLYLVDLAGSERVRKSEVEGKALKEAQHINKSLSALGNVMEALDQKSSHVPYRDSKLTYLLRELKEALFVFVVFIFCF